MIFRYQQFTDFYLLSLPQVYIIDPERNRDIEIYVLGLRDRGVFYSEDNVRYRQNLPIPKIAAGGNTDLDLGSESYFNPGIYSNRQNFAVKTEESLVHGGMELRELYGVTEHSGIKHADGLEDEHIFSTDRDHRFASTDLQEAQEEKNYEI